jgi:formamidopyrimidine-DNA glycosylase
MPEVIEVRYYTDFIRRQIRDHGKYTRLLSINILQGRYKTHGPFDGYSSITHSLPLRVIDVDAKGKYMYIILENEWVIGVTLGLTGGWFFRKNMNGGRSDRRLTGPSPATPLPEKDDLVHGLHHYRYDPELVTKYINNASKHLNVAFEFDTGILYFYDQLSFGTIKVFQSLNLLHKKLEKIGVDIMDPRTSSSDFIEKIHKIKDRNRAIGNILLDQKIIAGIGNYLRADSLWHSRISPFRPIEKITDSELSRLYSSLRLLVWGAYSYKLGVKYGIIREGQRIPDDFNRDFFIYMQERDVYGNDVKKEKLYEGSQIRYIHWVPERQK